VAGQVSPLAPGHASNEEPSDNLKRGVLAPRPVDEFDYAFYQQAGHSTLDGRLGAMALRQERGKAMNLQKTPFLGIGLMSVTLLTFGCGLLQTSPVSVSTNTPTPTSLVPPTVRRFLISTHSGVSSQPVVAGDHVAWEHKAIPMQPLYLSHRYLCIQSYHRERNRCHIGERTWRISSGRREPLGLAT
jgi:hypothetical protein